ncbi:PEP/pyruvate-binding domain-containing protein [Massilia sp.]|uniref:PEP/pyruvate-binding domain-containing protein n=1 Tax=Massilia sp. TaxID=1882437 RepID=UPI00391B65EC
MDAHTAQPGTEAPAIALEAGPCRMLVGGSHPLTRALAGGKAHALDLLARAGFPVPAAMVLTTDFFAPWIAQVGAMPAWQALTRAPQAEWEAHCAPVQAALAALDWTPAQSRVLDGLVRDCVAWGAEAGFAVRSSAPEEDLDNASFAGVYRSCLGVAVQDIGQAVRACFASCLDLPVLAYKAARGLPVFGPAIAVIVQRQLDSEVSGVGFSINPLTNDHDEMLVSANWGLGDAVVDGRVMADQFVLDKASGRVLGGSLGSKRIASVLAPATGTLERSGCGSEAPCLAPAQLEALAAMLARIESLFGRPMDVEFAFAVGTLHVLQARPVSTWVPLPPAMLSAPGAPRTLYLDIALAKGMTINAPVSPMGQDWLRHTIACMVAHCAGAVALPLDRADGWLSIQGGRMYLNLSRMLWLATPRQLARSNAPTDALLARTLATIDVARYRAPQRASALPLLRLLPRMLWRLRRPLWRSLQAFAAPQHAHRLYRQRECRAKTMLSAPVEAGTSLPALQERLGAIVAETVIDIAMPAMVAGLGAAGALNRLARKDCAVEQRLVAQLGRGMSGNLVVDMGIAMYRLARMLPPADLADPGVLAQRIARAELPTSFLDAWQRFMATYGCRGPGEMDLAHPSYRDDPAMLLRQMSFMAAAPAGHDPEAAHRQLAGEREAAYRALLARFGPLRRLLLKRLYAMSSLFAGTRDTPKHFNLLARQRLREHVLAKGAELAATGRLDNAQDVFGLAYADLEPEPAGAGACLRARLRERGAFLDLLARQVRTFPALLDSRGRILRAPPCTGAAGQLRGTGLSPGVVRGRVKCLRTAHEKAVAPGDILVAFTTDPGWTPLFISAGAIVLEVGGVLQHGALVARELNKPCVAGIGDVFARLCDGQLVEVDGEHGTVTIVDPA